MKNNSFLVIALMTFLFSLSGCGKATRGTNEKRIVDGISVSSPWNENSKEFYAFIEGTGPKPKAWLPLMGRMPTPGPGDIICQQNSKVFNFVKTFGTLRVKVCEEAHKDYTHYKRDLNSDEIQQVNKILAQIPTQKTPLDALNLGFFSGDVGNELSFYHNDGSVDLFNNGPSSDDPNLRLWKLPNLDFLNLLEKMARGV